MSSRAVSLLVVNYNSAELTRRAIASARAATSARLQVVVVDNSNDHDTLFRARVADEVLWPGRNLGFGGGVNHGLHRCTADVVVVANPDVIFQNGAIDALVESLSGSVAISGPKLTWDDAGRWLLPPADEPTLLSKLSEVAATRVPRWDAERSRRRVRRRLAFWLDNAARPVPSISGAVMCVDKAAVEREGGFDERFHLYFEEIDLMRRLRTNRRTILYNPNAVCRHLFNQSAGQETSSPARYLESERAYHAKWHGAAFVRLTRLLARERAESKRPWEPWPPEDPIAVPDPVEDHLVEASPLATFDVATGFFPNSNQVRFPAEVWESYRGAALFVRVVHRGSLTVVRQGRLDKDKMESR